MASLTAQTQSHPATCFQLAANLGFHQRHEKLYTEGTQKLLLDFQEQRHSCQGEAALRQQLKVNGGRATKEGDSRGCPTHLRKIDILQKKDSPNIFSKKEQLLCVTRSQSLWH